MISGVHAIFYTKRTRKMYAFLRDVLELRYVDAGNGRLMFAAPPTELAVHETEGEAGHELWLICDDIQAAVKQMKAKRVKTSPIQDRGWGLTTTLTLPDGETLGMYEPRHLSPLRRKKRTATKKRR